ncbi:hypothetical protein Tco_0417888 [Tanacetum coccineum]
MGASQVELVKENKRSRTSALKTELRSITLGDLSIEAYFQKVESLHDPPPTMLVSTVTLCLRDDVLIMFLLPVSPSKYDQKYVVYALPNHFLRISRRFVPYCSPRDALEDYGLSFPCRFLFSHGSYYGTNVVSLTSPTSNTLPSPSVPTVAFHTGLAMIPPGFAASHPSFGPPGFPAQPSGSPYPPAHVTHPNGTQQPNGANGSLIGPTSLLGQATILPHAFNAETLQDPTNIAWNMDSGASTHLNSSINSLSEFFNN